MVKLSYYTQTCFVFTGGISASTSLIILHQLEDKLKAHAFMLDFLKGVRLWAKVKNEINPLGTSRNTNNIAYQQVQIRQVCLALFYLLKAWPNARNISTQHLATLLGTRCCVRLATLL